MNDNTPVRAAALARPLLGLAALLLLAACSVLGGGPQHPLPQRYTLTHTAAAGQAQTQAAGHGPRYPFTLDLRAASAPDWLDSRRMLYRLSYAENSRLSAYTRSAWAAKPANLVGGSLDQALTRRHMFTAVLKNAPGNADLMLQVNLRDFSQYFSSAGHSHGRIAAQATLLDSKSGRVIAQHNFTASAPAPSADAQGGVAALSHADSRLNRALVHWLDETLAHCGPACPGHAAAGNS